MTDFFPDLAPETEPERPVAIARIALDLSLDRALEYGVPESMRLHIRVGSRVEVRLRNTLFKGFVLELVELHAQMFDGALKLIERLCEHEPSIPENLIKLGLWMAQYYICPQEAAIRTLLPGSVRKNKPKTAVFLTAAEPERTDVFMRDEAKRKKAQAKALRLLIDAPEGIARKTLLESGIKAETLRQLKAAGLLIEETRIIASPLIAPDPVEAAALESPHPLTHEQANALKIFSELYEKTTRAGAPPEQHVLLLHGVTGSGKTEVYLQAIDRVLQSGKEAIVVVPEIALTPQTVLRFRRRFGDRISILHSSLSDKERVEQWRRINEGTVRLAIGARSVLFAPFRNLGLIVIDEEHESSYKQSEQPRYCARDVAVMRGYSEHAVVMLGSATPSFESYANAQSNKYAYAELTERPNFGTMPDARIIDMQLEVTANGPSIFSKPLIEAVYDRLNRKEQVILFLNRRGFAKQLICEACGYVAQCPDCAVTLTYHKRDEMLCCHWCGMHKPAPVKCPQCDDPNIRYSGTGTEKIEQIAQKLFPSARIIRMDSDTMKKAEDYEEALSTFRNGQADILIGTQMIAKGLHFPRVTLVGVLNADMGLYIPDFRAEERTFSLLTQVSGRSGRGVLPGEVLIQTRTPGNPAITLALEHDYAGFYQHNAPMREAMGYPPFTRMIVILFRGEDETRTAQTAQAFYQALLPAVHDELELNDPVPAPIERLKGKYRYCIVLRGVKLAAMRARIRDEVCHGRYAADVEISVDVDPQQLL